MNPHRETGWRLKAAREARGISSAQKLAEHLGEKGLSYRTLANMEAGRKELDARSRVFIAQRLGIPESFFTAPLERLGDMALDLPTVSPSIAEVLAPALDATSDALDLQSRPTRRARPGQGADQEPPRRRGA